MKLGFGGILAGSSLVKSGYFRALRHKADSWVRQNVTKHESALVLISSWLMLTVFSKLAALRTKVRFNKNEVIAL